MRKLASIVEISGTIPIIGADKIEVATMANKGWQVVVMKNEFKQGDRAVYFEIDSALPYNDSRYEFLKERCGKQWYNKGILVIEVIRIKTIKLRGIVSQGLLIPIHMFPELEEYGIDSDVTDILNVKHYDELSEEVGRITGTAKIAGSAKGNFPSFFPKTDEERIQNLSNFFTKMKGVLFECTEKADGSSCSIYYSPTYKPESPFGVCSRNIDLKEDDTNVFWNTIKKYDIQNKLPIYCAENNIELAIQGELVGIGMNGNRDLLDTNEYKVFRIFNITEQRFLTPQERYDVVNDLNLDHVLIIDEKMDVFNIFNTMEDLLKFSDGITERGNPREGLVYKAIDGSCSFKAVSNQYLLKEKS